MKRILLIVTLGLVMLGLSPAAHAATDFSNAPRGAHYAKGYAEPVCTFTTATTVSCTGTHIVGVGNTNAVVLLEVTSTFTGECHNPGSKSKVVEPFTESDTNTTTAELKPSKNGRLVVPAQTETGTSISEFEDTFTCPNPNWDADVTSSDVSYVYTLTFVGFTQPAITITG